MEYKGIEDVMSLDRYIEVLEQLRNLIGGDAPVLACYDGHDEAATIVKYGKIVYVFYS